MNQILKSEIGTYNINISDDSLSTLMENIYESTKNQKKLFVISKKVHRIYADLLNISKDCTIIINDGEKEKNIKNYLRIIQKAFELKLNRNDVIIAIGGGVIGDISGFAASTYMRGIDYIQVPTTLLSMVDSCVGGKTAIDTVDAKNLIGSFYQPKEVFININFIKTLDDKQFRSGLGEVLKYGFIENNCQCDKKLFLFEYLTLCCEKFLCKDLLVIIRIIEYCLRLKIAVVNQDEKETTGIRKILNLGHTFGHALETITKFKAYTHGEAIIQGIFFVFNWAYKQNLITYSYYRLSIELLNKYGFHEDKKVIKKFGIEKLAQLMFMDKKTTNNGVAFIIPNEKKEVKEVLISDIKSMF